MVRIIHSPTQIKAAGTKDKIINEYIGCVNSQTHDVSIAVMQSPKGWEEPGQVPEFDEYTLVFSGMLQVETKTGTFYIKPGQAVIVNKNEWVRYSTPLEDAEYVAVCLPAFTPGTVHRDE